jgi:hypothetical protein
MPFESFRDFASALRSGRLDYTQLDSRIPQSSFIPAYVDDSVMDLPEDAEEE